MLRRFSLGVALSVVVHAAVVSTIVGVAFMRDSTPSRVDVDIMGMRLDELKDLPLGAPDPGRGAARPRPRVRAPASQAKEGTLATREERDEPKAATDDGDADEGGVGASDLRQLGPEGSRFTLLLRVDRLKDTPFAEPVDALLMRMPDRRDLLEGTGLSLYSDFEALLISTPNPMDYKVTFLAARHHVSDAAMRAAIDRGARATGRTVAWRTEARRPWGERRARAAAATSASVSRDERIIVLPAPGLIVVTPPTYRAILLAPPRKPSVSDGGVAAAGPDGGVVDAGGAPPPSWTTLLRRIDAEDGLLGPTAVAMASAVDLFKSRAGAPISFLGTSFDIPRLITVVLGVDGDPYVEITGEYADEEEARRWERGWPALQSKLRGNPYVVLSGFSPIVSRATTTREGSIVKLRITATTDETVRLLRLAASAIPG